MAMVEQAVSKTGYQTGGQGLVEVIDLILDKGLVLDAFIRVSVIGIELVTIDARIVIASVDTYLRFAEAVNRLDLTQTKEATTYKELVEGSAGGAAKSGTEGALEGVKEELKPGRGKSKEGGGEGRQRGRGSKESKEEDQEDDRGGVFSRLAERGRRS